MDPIEHLAELMTLYKQKAIELIEENKKLKEELERERANRYTSSST
jgi:hypothetical protein